MRTFVLTTLAFLCVVATVAATPSTSESRAPDYEGIRIRAAYEKAIGNLIPSLVPSLTSTPAVGQTVGINVAFVEGQDIYTLERDPKSKAPFPVPLNVASNVALRVNTYVLPRPDKFVGESFWSTKDDIQGARQMSRKEGGYPYLRFGLCEPLPGQVVYIWASAVPRSRQTATGWTRFVLDFRQQRPNQVDTIWLPASNFGSPRNAIPEDMPYPLIRSWQYSRLEELWE